MRAQAIAKRNSLIVLSLMVFGGWYGWNRLFDYESKNNERATAEIDARQRKSDAEFCKQNRDYYEDFCKLYPDHCKEGASEKARCAP